MAALIKWTNEARITFEKNINYLIDNWTEKEIKRFVKQSNDIIERIEAHPEMFTPSRKNSMIRRALVNKYIVLYYKYHASKNEVLLLSFWHSRQDPKKLKY
jgi:plasmid stabilization system protein ParE